MADFANGVSLPATILPDFASASMPAVVLTSTSADSPPAIFFASTQHLQLGGKRRRQADG